MVNKILFRVDGNSSIGHGHLMRCYALAEMLKSRFTVDFFCKEVPNSLLNAFKQKNLAVNIISIEDEFLEVLNGDGIVVLDHYGLDTAFQKIIKEKGNKLVCIDDLHEKEFYADLIINHAPGILPSDYKAQSYTQYALGIEYAMLRPEFLKLARQKEKKTNLSKKGVFVCFGGSDPEDLTRRSLDILIDIKLFDEIKIVTGSAYSNYGLLVDYISSKKDDKIFLYQNLQAEAMIAVMKSCSHALVPASGILLEVMALGLIPVAGMYINNQQFIYENYKAINAFADAGNFEERDLREALLSLKFTKKKNSNLIDGKSSQRLLKTFSALLEEANVSLEEAKADDLQVTYNWAKNPEVRAYSFSKSEIGYEEHKNWLFAKIEDDNCYYFIARINDCAVGSIRFDKHNREEAIVSYLLDPEFHGKGLGLSLLKLGVEKLKITDNNIKYVTGYVMNNNIASLKIFRKLGYEEGFGSGNEVKFKKEIRK
ncbi:UDP-2,4-diacetamido-2,4,6-trideoxy-beta-L-altropyranose hydrolase [Salinimicrobium sp. MT39]|uniref:UDP-2,4-diacetamido-2,4, 6-trideoxy-beta-L-altropyranose hydrolase n=1 Tax=Salinimicrobium profundisediminis TaxID=2994553 RepID=A0A9X3CWD2_9FLAO|nr:UDP-2,4-diacetamido-2,4,6-trideoxy-beta-L-altropyranose hydrolase [Salinimicrobium profundisediminis]MCX2837914.1 UDP-2,4-diacetamido-2,4,6-trideoxy-beta-L-altropyranose hydrolase [Salinimicrobium profundisediminis]